jgi:hypothetical protein
VKGPFLEEQNQKRGFGMLSHSVPAGNEIREQGRAYPYERGKNNLRVNRQKMSLRELAESVSAIHGVSMNELRAGSRRRGILKARQDFSQVAVKLLGYAGAEVSRYLGVTSSCVTRIASQEERLEDLRTRYKIC